MSDQLPSNPSLDHLKHQARNLQRDHAARDVKALERVKTRLPDYEGRLSLAKAQAIIAREYGFDSWPELKKHVTSSTVQSMHEAVANHDASAIQKTFGRNPQSVNELNESGHPPLYTAALYRNTSAIDFLLNHGATLDIFACAYLGKAQEGEALLQDNPALDRATQNDGLTALHYAARAGHHQWPI